MLRRGNVCKVGWISTALVVFDDGRWLAGFGNSRFRMTVHRDPYSLVLDGLSCRSPLMKPLVKPLAHSPVGVCFIVEASAALSGTTPNRIRPSMGAFLDLHYCHPTSRNSTLFQQCFSRCRRFCPAPHGLLLP